MGWLIRRPGKSRLAKGGRIWRDAGGQDQSRAEVSRSAKLATIQ